MGVLVGRNDDVSSASILYPLDPTPQGYRPTRSRSGRPQSAHSGPLYVSSADGQAKRSPLIQIQVGPTLWAVPMPRHPYRCHELLT